MTGHLDFRESSDTYFVVVVREGRYRVIPCRDSIQWIIQRHTAPSKNAAGGRWVAEDYLTTRAALARLWQVKTGVVRREILELPERFGRATRAQYHV